MIEVLPYALSLLQPWAWLIMHGGKNVENRGWPPPAMLVGRRFWIHASKGGSTSAIVDTFEDLVQDALLTCAPPLDQIARGAIVGSVQLVEVIQPLSQRADTLLGNPWYTGSVAWVVSDPQPLAKPVPATGMRKIWRVPATVLDLLDKAA